MIAALMALALALFAEGSAAETRRGSTARNVPNAVQGFSKNRNLPIQIDAKALEVQDKSKTATFRGSVHVKQGDTELRCNVLVVHYEENGSGGTSGAQPNLLGSDAQRIRLLEAKGKVVVTQKDQVATGDTGIFDMRKNTITLRGNVVISQGRNVLRGDRLVVDMTTAVSRVESDSGRVRGMFQPSTRGDDARNGGSLMPRLR